MVQRNQPPTERIQPIRDIMVLLCISRILWKKMISFSGERIEEIHLQEFSIDEDNCSCERQRAHREKIVVSGEDCFAKEPEHGKVDDH